MLCVFLNKIPQMVSTPYTSEGSLQNTSPLLNPEEGFPL